VRGQEGEGEGCEGEGRDLPDQCETASYVRVICGREMSAG